MPTLADDRNLGRDQPNRAGGRVHTAESKSAELRAISMSLLSFLPPFTH
jgi:hypothetical protein